MSGYFDAFSTLGGTLGVVGDVAKIGFGLEGISNRNKMQEQAQKNWQADYNFANKQFDYMQQQNLLTQQREDTSMQRRVEDLKAAGLNPVLAAGGQGASAQTVSTAGASSSRSNQVASAMLDMELGLGAMSAEKLASERDLNKALADKARAEAGNIPVSNAQVANAQDIERARLVFEQSKLSAQVTQWANENGLTKLIADAATRDAATRSRAQDIADALYRFETTVQADGHIPQQERWRREGVEFRAGYDLSLSQRAHLDAEVVKLANETAKLARELGYMGQQNVRDWISTFGNLVPSIRLNF